MKLLFTRHGQTEWNVLGKVQGRADISLNEKGKEQARKTAEKLQNEDFDLIICSPLKRARETAEIINIGRNVPVIYDETIAERDFGEFEGVQKEEFDFPAFWSYKKNENYVSAENIKKFFKRIYTFIEDIKKKYKDKTILIVSHGGVSIPFQCYFAEIPDMDSLLPMGIDNCEVLKYNF